MTQVYKIKRFLLNFSTQVCSQWVEINTIQLHLYSNQPVIQVCIFI
jgi:hypothetical protein